ncbi:MAG: winged helix DNA-binding domain-containing protein [Propionibacteriales bacterium]|nr:winged helix DNA-binding domain-containing protein [Propionibacteriales bacterium]
MTPHHLTIQQARRIAVRAQLLEADRPTDLLQVVRRLTLLQADATVAVAPSAELVLWSRLGADHTRGDLDAALAAGTVVEIQGMIRPAEDVALLTAEMAAWPTQAWQVPAAEWVQANDDARRDVLAKLYDDGPLPASELPDTTVLPWQSGGWNNDRSLRMLLERMVERGEIATAGRDGRERLWDLAERIYPETPPVPLAEARQILARRRLAALGLARAKAAKTPAEPNDVGPVGEVATIEGVRGRWRVDPAYLLDDFTERAAILSPLDRLVFDRKRMVDLFDFDYQLEMYKPAAKRRWGYWAMPILYGDQLVGKVDATAQRDGGVLRINAVHQEAPLDEETRTMINDELVSLADFLGLGLEQD